MADRQLDDALRQGAPVPPEATVCTALLLARQVRAVGAGAVALRRRRPVWLAAAVVGLGP